LKSGDGLTTSAMKGGKYCVLGGNGIAGMHDEFNLSGDNVIIGRVGALCGNARHVSEKIWLTDNAFRIVDR
jgi:type I restriction enzyme S subunit